MRPARLLLLALLPILACGLAACAGDPNEEAVQCPKAFLLPDADHQQHYNGQADISTLVLGVRLTDVHGACSGKLGVRREAARAHVVMVVTRGPAAKGPDAEVAYKVGLVRDNHIWSERSYVQHVTFPPNVDVLQVTGADIPMTLPTGKDVSGENYHLYFWLPLTPAELDFNRRHPA